MTGWKRGLVEMSAVGGPDMAAQDTFSDDKELGGGTEELRSDGVKVRVPGAFFRKITGDNAKVTGLEKIPDGLAEAPCAAVEGYLDAMGLGMPHSGAGRALVAPVEVQQPHTVQHCGFEDRVRNLGGKEDDLARTIVLADEDDGTGLGTNGIHQGTRVAVGSHDGQGRGDGPAYVGGVGSGLRHTLGGGKRGNDVELVQCLRANTGHFERNGGHATA